MLGEAEMGKRKGRNCFTQVVKKAGGKKGCGTIYKPRATRESRRTEDQEED